MITITTVAPPPPEIQVRAIQLTSGEDVGLVVGGSSIPIPQLYDDYVTKADAYVHPTYVDLTPEQLTPVADGGTAIVLPTTPGYDGATTYYMIPMAPGETLPLLRPLESIPIIGKPLADLLQPDLTQIVNLGYDNPDNLGWAADRRTCPPSSGSSRHSVR